MSSRPAVKDLLLESVAGTVQRAGRTLLTMLGTVLGVGAFVAVLGITASATGQISERFTDLMATEVTVESTGNPDELPDPAFPNDAEQRLQSLNGVRHAGVYWPVDGQKSGVVTSVPVDGMQAGRLTVLAASPGYLDAVGARVTQGRIYDSFHQTGADRVAVLGAAAAKQLGISNVAFQPAIFVNGLPFAVIGIVDDVRRQPEVLLDVVVPSTTAFALWAYPKQPVRMLIETELGAAQLVGAQAAVALRPDAPSRFRVFTPPDPHSLRDAVNTDLSALFLILSGLCLLIGGAGIANTTLVAVMERVPEIGLRRALGARRHHIAAQFLAECGLLGALGGLVGAALGALAVVTTALAHSWTPIIAPWTIASAPAIGLAVGVLAGLYPALRAAGVEPSDALRR